MRSRPHSSKKGNYGGTSINIVIRHLSDFGVKKMGEREDGTAGMQERRSGREKKLGMPLAGGQGVGGREGIAWAEGARRLLVVRQKGREKNQRRVTEQTVCRDMRNKK